MRHTVWESNKKYIDGHNEHAHTLGFTLAMNEFGDLVCIHSLNRLKVDLVVNYTDAQPPPQFACDQ